MHACPRLWWPVAGCDGLPRLPWKGHMTRGRTVATVVLLFLSLLPHPRVQAQKRTSTGVWPGGQEREGRGQSYCWVWGSLSAGQAAAELQESCTRIPGEHEPRFTHTRSVGTRHREEDAFRVPSSVCT